MYRMPPPPRLTLIPILLRRGLRHEGERRALRCLKRGSSPLRRPNQPHGHRMMSAAWTTMTSPSTLVAEHHMSQHQNVGVPAARSRNRWIASGEEEWGSGRGDLSLEPEPSGAASGRHRISTPSRRREALCDRCAPMHATARVAANRPNILVRGLLTAEEVPAPLTSSQTAKCSRGLCGWGGAGRPIAFPLVRAYVVGATGFEPVTSSVSAKPREPLCYRPFSQVTFDRRGERETLS